MTTVNHDRPITVMLVDDENLFLEDLLSIYNWGENGFEVVATAHNGREAWSFFQKYKPQIVITDIKMPDVDGLDLITQIHDSGAKTKLILLTAYDDFNYAKQAIQNKVEGYILKQDISEKLLNVTLTKLKNEILSETTQSRILMNSLVSDMFYRVQSTISAGEKSSEFNSFCKQLFYCFFIEMDLPLTSKSRPIESNLDFIFSTCTRLFTPKGTCFSLDSNRVLLVIDQKIGDQLDAESSPQDISDKLLVALKMNDISHTIYYFNKQISLTGAREFFAKHPYTFIYKYFSGVGKSYNINNIRIPTLIKEVVEIDSATLNKLFAANNQAEINNYLDSFFELLIQSFNMAALDKAFRTLYHMLHENAKNLIDKTAMNELNTFFDKNEICDAPHLCKWAKMLAGEIIRMNSFANKSWYTGVIKNCIEYLNSNYAQKDLNISQVAEHVSLSTGRLSNIFKSKTGTTVNQMLTDIRINRAKFYMDMHKYRIYEIAEMVGYSSSQYFSHIFQLHEGITPKQFVERINM